MFLGGDPLNAPLSWGSPPRPPAMFASCPPGRYLNGACCRSSFLDCGVLQAATYSRTRGTTLQWFKEYVTVECQNTFSAITTLSTWRNWWLLWIRTYRKLSPSKPCIPWPVPFVLSKNSVRYEITDDHYLLTLEHLLSLKQCHFC